MTLLEELKAEKIRIEKEHGLWTAHNIKLAEDFYTMGPGSSGSEFRSHAFLQIASDIAAKPISQMRVLDLACLEGQFGIEFALAGAQVVGIEGRLANIEKARFAKKALALTNIDFHQDDVRNLSREKYGRFDVVVCCGILYHMDDTGVFDLIHHIREVCTGVAIFDTHISRKRPKKVTYKDCDYHGKDFFEGPDDVSQEEKDRALWSSIGNRTSFWPTRESLVNALHEAGFTSISESLWPALPVHGYDRLCLIAVCGTKQPIHTFPNFAPTQRIPEKSRYHVLYRELLGYIPDPVKKLIKTALGKRKRYHRTNQD
ncbi:MAG: class I SAM-dependent methyltransferase [Kiritimatiellia bacterium]